MFQIHQAFLQPPLFVCLLLLGISRACFCSENMNSLDSHVGPGLRSGQADLIWSHLCTSLSHSAPPISKGPAQRSRPRPHVTSPLLRALQHGCLTIPHQDGVLDGFLLVGLRPRPPSQDRGGLGPGAGVFLVVPSPASHPPDPPLKTRRGRWTEAPEEEPRPLCSVSSLFQVYK